MSDGRESEPAPILASDAEREHSISQLRVDTPGWIARDVGEPA